MPSIITHSMVGLAGANAVNTGRTKFPKRFWFFSLLLPVLPDADTIAFFFGIPYGHFLGHRGFFHSLFFALIPAILVVGFFFREKKPKERFLFLLYFFLITASHGLLDALTNGGLGIALLSPFETTRYFFPWRPIKVAPIGVMAFFSDWGLRVIINEILFIWLPSWLLVIIMKMKLSSKSYDGSSGNRPHDLLK